MTSFKTWFTFQVVWNKNDFNIKNKKFKTLRKYMHWKYIQWFSKHKRNYRFLPFASKEKKTTYKVGHFKGNSSFSLYSKSHLKCRQIDS